ncbi:MAG TPA: Asp-tRNA(Asn)/Glu-tRNA(Gln) amidotransferase subunit GatC [Anaerolineales bacterium]|nr:Asp-tRNA(Asn)/Glu-tRNA(Gln) amidotransferase subunit GatC [Anaerolineales bacterium]
MPITREEIKHIANLARLQLTEEEIVKYEKQLTNILDFFSQLKSIKDLDFTKSNDAIDHTLLRQDEPFESDTALAILQNSADVDKNQFRIPPVF